MSAHERWVSAEPVARQFTLNIAGTRLDFRLGPGQSALITASRVGVELQLLG